MPDLLFPQVWPSGGPPSRFLEAAQWRFRTGPWWRLGAQAQSCYAHSLMENVNRAGPNSTDPSWPLSVGLNKMRCRAGRWSQLWLRTSSVGESRTGRRGTLEHWYPGCSPGLKTTEKGTLEEKRRPPNPEAARHCSSAARPQHCPKQLA